MQFINIIRQLTLPSRKPSQCGHSFNVYTLKFTCRNTWLCSGEWHQLEKCYINKHYLQCIWHTASTFWVALGASVNNTRDGGSRYPAVTGWEARYTLDRLLVCHRTNNTYRTIHIHIHTYRQFRITNANSIQKGPSQVGVKSTISLWSSSANHCATMLYITHQLIWFLTYTYIIIIIIIDKICHV